MKPEELEDKVARWMTLGLMLVSSFAVIFVVGALIYVLVRVALGGCP